MEEVQLQDIKDKTGEQWGSVRTSHRCARHNTQWRHWLAQHHTAANVCAGVHPSMHLHNISCGLPSIQLCATAGAPLRRCPLLPPPLGERTPLASLHASRRLAASTCAWVSTGQGDGLLLILEGLEPLGEQCQLAVRSKLSRRSLVDMCTVSVQVQSSRRPSQFLAVTHKWNWSADQLAC